MPFHLTSFLKENYCKIAYLVNLQTLSNNVHLCNLFSNLLQIGIPIPEELPESVPWEPDSKRVTEEPFKLMTWVQNNMNAIKTSGNVPLFDPEIHQTDVYIHGLGDKGRAYKVLFLF